MARNGSGTYVPPTNSWSPAVNGTLATTADWQSLLNDIVAALTQSVSKDGQTVMTGPLDFGGFNLTNVGSAAITALTGTPTAPTAAPGTNTTQIATTAFVQAGLATKQDADSDLTAIAALSGSGLIARTGSGAAATRTLAAGSARVTVTNGDGVSGNPTIDVVPGTGTGDVMGPSSSTDSVLALFDGITGKLLKEGGSASHNGNLTIVGSARRILADFSDATFANRTMFQTSVPASSTFVGLIPSSATAGSTIITMFGHSDTANSPLFSFTCQNNSGQASIAVEKIGTGSYLDLFFYNGGLARMKLSTAGDFSIGTAALSTSATTGFFWAPSCAGTPSGSPTAPYTNAAAIVADTTNSRLYVRIGSTWKYAALT